jgi:uncharacterized protein YprB with RNaseH-like and TPR domain
MDLREKLERIDPDSGLRTSAEVPRPPGRRLSDYVPGREVPTPYGPCFSVRWEYDLDYHHGSFQLQKLLTLTGKEVETLTFDQCLSGFDFQRAAFVDVETSSLSGGVGTFAFLTGVAYLENDTLYVEQYLMRDFIEEPNLLHLLSERLRGFSYLVTYNGKCFDTSILSARYLLNRLNSPLGSIPHLDLLFPARRLWKRRFKDCSLTHLERALLDFQRVEDIPSHLIPHIYFDYLRDNDPEMLVPVFNHNRDDLISLVALTGTACELVQEDRPFFLTHPVDLLSLGRHFYRAGQFQKTISILEQIPDRELSSQVKEEYHFLLGDCYKRLSFWDRAERVWSAYLESGQTSCLHFHLELAKLYEHRIKDLSKAQQMTALALSSIENLSADWGGRLVSVCRTELLHRLNRIERKQLRRSSK